MNRNTTILQTEITTLTSIRRSQLNTNPPERGERLGGIPLDSTDIQTAVENRTINIQELRERRIRHFDDSQILTQDQNSAETLELNPTRGQYSTVQQTQTSVYDGFTSFFERDLYGRPAILTLRPDITPDEIVTRARIPESATVQIRNPRSEISEYTSLNLRELWTRVDQSILQLRNSTNEYRLVSYRNHVNHTFDNSDLNNIDFLALGLHASLSLLPTPVLAFIILNLDISSISTGAIHTFFFLNGFLQLFRPFLLTATNPLLWASTTVTQLRELIRTTAQRIRFNRQRIMASSNPIIEIQHSLRIAGQTLRERLNDVHNNIQRNVSHIINQRNWSTQFLTIVFGTGTLAVGSILMSYPESFWYVLSLGLRLLNRFPTNLIRFLTYPFNVNSRENAENAFSTWINNEISRISDFDINGFDIHLRNVLENLATYFY